MKLSKIKFSLPDPELALNVLSIFAISCLALFTASGGDFLVKQAVFFSVALFLVAITYKIFDLSFFQKYAVVIYFLNIGLLLLLKVFGTTVLGSQRWLRLGPLSLQPSEIAKVALIIFLSAWLSKRPIKNYYDIFRALLVVSIPAGLVVIQPDLGTTLVYIAISFGMLFWAGAKLIELAVMVSPLATAILASFGHKIISYKQGKIDFALTVPLAIFFVVMIIILVLYYRAWRSPWVSSAIFALLSFNILVMMFKSIAWGFLKEYQQKRLTIFLDPHQDPLGAGYHIIQSLYAIGSGGLFGKGLKSGDLTQGQFVPEQHTDFVFSSIGEELGFFGAIALVLLYTWLCLNIISVAKESKDRFVSFICIGTFSMMFFHIFVNIGMNLSIMPITGVPLPFMSYGGSSMLVNLFLISLVMKGAKQVKRS
jgi:rod shape determining protein RodA